MKGDRDTRMKRGNSTAPKKKHQKKTSFLSGTQVERRLMAAGTTDGGIFYSLPA